MNPSKDLIRNPARDFIRNPCIFNPLGDVIRHSLYFTIWIKIVTAVYWCATIFSKLIDNNTKKCK